MFLKKIMLLLLGSALLVTPASSALENTIKKSSQKSIVIKLGNADKKSDKMSSASKSALACGYITSVAIISRFIQEPVGLWDFFCKAAGVSITVCFTGSWISELYYPIFAWLAHLNSDDSKEHVTHDSLVNLITQWNIVKKDVPESLRNKFDQFCEQYEKNGQLEITEEQALVFVKEIIQEINRVYNVYNLANQEAVTTSIATA